MSKQTEIINQNNFAYIFSSYKNKIYNLVYKMTLDKEVSEDITQETFIKCYEKLDDFRGDSQLYTWLYSIAKNQCLRFLEKQRQYQVENLEQLLNTTSSPFIETISPLEKNNYITQVKEGCLLGLLKTLPFTQRVVFILHVLYELPISNTSEIVGKSISATRTLLHRARKNIKGFLCKNCSLYDSSNICKCENMINFSLKQGWIKYKDYYPSNLPEKIWGELNEIKKITSLYTTLPHHKLPEKINQQIIKIINNDDLLIFSKKKVK